MKVFFNSNSNGASLPRFVLTWLLAAPAAYGVCGFLGDYHPAFFSILFLAVLSQTAASLFTRQLLLKAEAAYLVNRRGFWVALALISGLLVFALEMILAAKHFPLLFNMRYLLVESAQIAPFEIGMVIALPAFILIQHRAAPRRWTSALDQNAAGILVALLFFLVYFVFSFIFNQPAFDVDDIFFDSDGWLWRTRFATPNYQDYYWRAVHPFALLIIRPLVAILAAPLQGDRYAAAFLLPPLAGAFCVFLAWRFVKEKTGNSPYAMLIASLLGGSAAHLVYSSLLETYIFLAALVMLTVVFTLRKTPLAAYLLTGLLSFGISLSSVIPPVIFFALKQRSLKQWLTYGFAVLILGFSLTLINNAVYPKSQPYFFDPHAYGTEGRSTFQPSLRRETVVARVMFAYSFVAPDPLVFMRELKFFKVWMVDVSRKFNRSDPDFMQVSEYKTTFGTLLAAFWLGLGGLGFIGLLSHWRKKQDIWLSLSFLLVILFSLVFHLRFGKELFLYATNWVYAVTLLLALGWKNFARRAWFLSALLAFILLMLANNARLLFVMLGASAAIIR